MKKVLATILSLVYLIATSGIGINLRYCCDKLDKVELSFTGATSLKGDVSCGMQSAYRGKDCCKDVHKQLKITQSQNMVQDISFPAGHSFAIALPCFPQIPDLYLSSIVKGNFSPHAPPFRETNPVYLKNCSFLI